MRLFALAVACFVSLSAAAQSLTAFTYQGHLTNSGVVVTASADFQFRLYDAPSGGAQLGPQVTASNVTVSAGRFSTTLDFDTVFSGATPLWLEIDVRSPAGSGSFSTLAPREPITPVPLAQALVGVPMLPNAGIPTLDLQQVEPGFIGYGIQYFQPCWQSFTADKSGLLSRIDLYVSGVDSSGANTLKIYSGVGTGGTLLATTEATPSGSGPLAFTGFSIPVTAGQKYTFGFTGTNGFQTANSAIPGAIGNILGGSVNWWFRTYLTGPLLTAAVSDAQMLDGKPASTYLPPTLQNWSVTNLPSSTINPATLKTVTGSTQTINLAAGSAAINWSTSARVNSVGIYQLRVRLGSNVGPWTYFAFNQVQVHTCISGNAAIPVPATGAYQISLEIIGPVSGSSYIIDQNDSITATVLNVRQ